MPDPVDDYAGSMDEGNCQPNYVSPHVVNPIDGGAAINGPINPDHDESKAPWVKMWFGEAPLYGSEDDPAITVGNESCPGCTDPHAAVITSFEYGFTDGIEAKITVLDEEGGSFEKIAQHLFKCIKKSGKDYNMCVQWGWVFTTCGGQVKVESSPKMRFAPMNIEVNIAKGAISYTVTACDLMQIVFNSKEMDTFGSEKDRVFLGQALDDLFKPKGGEEPGINFEKGRIEGGKMDAGTDIWEFQDSDEIGAAWTADGQNKLGTAVKWTENYLTDHRKGTMPFWKAGDEDPTIVFLEMDTGCTLDAGELEARSQGTFIINGGRCSNVIEFSPNINWVAAFAQMVAGGQAGSPASGEISKLDNTSIDGGCKIGEDNQGLQTTAIPSDDIISTKGFTDCGSEQEDAIKENAKAGASANMTNPIEASLTIQGDPSERYCTFMKAIGRTCAIIAINPWHIRSTPSSRGGCPDWLVRPAINAVLTNRFWMIKGITHTIKEGSYTTILKLVLPTPGIDIAPGEPPGADDQSMMFGGEDSFFTDDAC